jgi:preprotein translocase subunit SecG
MGHTQTGSIQKKNILYSRRLKMHKSIKILGSIFCMITIFLIYTMHEKEIIYKLNSHMDMLCIDEERTPFEEITN